MQRTAVESWTVDLDPNQTHHETGSPSSSLDLKHTATKNYNTIISTKHVSKRQQYVNFMKIH